MKTIFTKLLTRKAAILLATIAASAQALQASILADTTVAESVPDTIAYVKNPRQVLVTNTDSTLFIKIDGREDDSTYTFSYAKHYSNSSDEMHEASDRWNFGFPFKKDTSKKKSKSGWEIRSHAMAFGFVSSLGAPAGMDTKVGQSYELSFEPINLTYITKNRRNEFEINFSFGWRNYRMTGNKRFYRSDDGHVSLQGYPEGSDIQFSRIKVFSLGMPLRYSLSLGKEWGVSLAAIPTFNTYASIKTRYKYRDDGSTKYREVKDISKHIHQTPFTVDFMAGVLWKGVGIYCKYSPFNVLDAAYAPKFQSLSFGVLIGF